MDAPTEHPARRPLGSYRESLGGPLGAAPTARPQTNTEGPKRAQPVGQAQIPDPSGKLWDTGIYRAPKGLESTTLRRRGTRPTGPAQATVEGSGWVAETGGAGVLQTHQGPTVSGTVTQEPRSREPLGCSLWVPGCPRPKLERRLGCSPDGREGGGEGVGTSPSTARTHGPHHSPGHTFPSTARDTRPHRWGSLNKTFTSAQFRRLEAPAQVPAGRSLGRLSLSVLWMPPPRRVLTLPFLCARTESSLRGLPPSSYRDTYSLVGCDPTYSISITPQRPRLHRQSRWGSALQPINWGTPFSPWQSRTPGWNRSLTEPRASSRSG